MSDLEGRPAETEFTYERDLLNAFLENFPDSIYFKDLQSRFVRVSQAKLEKSYAFCLARHRAAYPDAPTLPAHLSSLDQFAHYLSGKSDADFFAGEDARYVFDEEREIIRTGRPMVGKLEKVTGLDGKTAWYLSTKVPWRDKEGKIIGTFGTSKDVTSLKESELSLQTQLERLSLLDRITRAIGERQDLRSIYQVVVRTLEDHLPIDFCCVCTYDQAGQSIDVSCVGVKGQPLASDLALPEQARISIGQNGLARCLRGQLVYDADISPSAFPFPQKLAQGGLRSLVMAPLQVESSVFGVLVAARREARGFTSTDCEFLRQLSEHVALAANQAQLHGALQKAYDQLRQSQQAVMQQERLRALGQMASGVAHDINNAISPVALYTESLLESEPNLSPRARNYLETIQHSIEDVAQTVARLREFYRQREPQMQSQPVQLNLLVNQVIELSRARWSDMPQQNGAYIETATDLAAGLPEVRGVESELREALLNLVFNAVDAMPKGGELTIRTKLWRKSSETTAAPSIAVEVSDTGIGMDDDTRRHCLEPFFTTKGERGTGLGLAMVYGIAQRHGAEVEIESAVGRGTTIRLILPSASESAAAAAKAPAQTPSARLRILVIDDDPILIKSLRDTLEGDGHIVVTANGGQAGINALRVAQSEHQFFPVVITDLGMPHMDGRQVAAAVKSLSPASTVILLTGWGQRLVEEGDIPPHVDLVLNKPPKLRELREALAGCARPVNA